MRASRAGDEIQPSQSLIPSVLFMLASNVEVFKFFKVLFFFDTRNSSSEQELVEESGRLPLLSTSSGEDESK